MNCKSTIRGLIFFTMTLYAVYSGSAVAQNAFEDALQKKTDSLLAQIKAKEMRPELLPNDVLQNLIAPSGWGGFGSYIFGGIGGDDPQPYGTRADLIAYGGFCVGDPRKAVNVAASVNVTDVHQISNLSGNVQVSRLIFTGSSISVGGLQLFANKQQSDAPGSTFYFAFSHALQWLSSKTPGASKLTYSIGVGTGRFYDKSPRDIAAGRGKHGTAVFGSISYEILRKVNFNTEWSGMNLGFSLGYKPFKSPLALGFGVTNLTRYSSDRANTSFIISYPLSVAR